MTLNYNVLRFLTSYVQSSSILKQHSFLKNRHGDHTYCTGMVTQRAVDKDISQDIGTPKPVLANRLRSEPRVSVCVLQQLMVTGSYLSKGNRIKQLNETVHWSQISEPCFHYIYIYIFTNTLRKRNQEEHGFLGLQSNTEIRSQTKLEVLMPYSSCTICSNSLKSLLNMM